MLFISDISLHYTTTFSSKLKAVFLRCQSRPWRSLHVSTRCWAGDQRLGSRSAWHVHWREAKTHDSVTLGIRRPRRRWADVTDFWFSLSMFSCKLMRWFTVCYNL